MQVFKKDFLSVFPEIFNRVSGNSLSVYLYICYHYCKSDKDHIRITLDEICNGLRSGDGRLDHGVGVTLPTARSAVRDLKEQRLLKARSASRVFCKRKSDSFNPHRIYYTPLVPLSTGKSTKFSDISTQNNTTSDDSDDINTIKNICESILNDVSNIFSRTQQNLAKKLANLSSPNIPLNSNTLGIRIDSGNTNTGCIGITKKQTPSLTGLHGTNDTIKSSNGASSHKTISNQENRTSSPSSKLPLLKDTIVTSSLDRFESAAYQLKYALDKRNKIMRRVSIKRWTSVFRRFSELSAIDWSRFKCVLDWYCANIDLDQYTPRAYSAGSFCDKFNRIEDAMTRVEQKKQQVNQRTLDYIAATNPLPVNPISTDDEDRIKRFRSEYLSDLI